MKALLVSTLLTLAASQAAFAADCSVDISGNDQMQFDKKSIVVPKACKSFKVNLIHSGKMPKAAMGHNWVLTETSAVQGVATDGMGAGLPNNYLKPGDARVLAATKVIGGGERDSVDVDVSKLKAGTDYTYFCSFPGHYGVMKGSLTLGS